MLVKKRPEATPAPQKLPASRRDAVGYEILLTAGWLRRSYTDLFEERDITYQQYNVMRILRGAGDQGLPTLEIVKRMIDHTPGITRLLDRLERKNLIRRERPAENRRKVICYVTRKGLAVLKEMDAPLQQRVRASVRCLSDEETDTLISYLSRIRQCR